MADDDTLQIFKMLSEAWVKAMEKEDFHDAIAMGMATYLILRQRQADKLALDALSFIHPAISSLLLSTGGTAAGKCSFCGRGGLHLHSSVVDTSQICEACVRLLAKRLGPPSPQIDPKSPIL